MVATDGTNVYWTNALLAGGTVKKCAIAGCGGVPTTIPMHVAILGSDAFRLGTYDTRAIPGWPAS